MDGRAPRYRDPPPDQLLQRGEYPLRHQVYTLNFEPVVVNEDAQMTNVTNVMHKAKVLWDGLNSRNFT